MTEPVKRILRKLRRAPIVSRKGIIEYRSVKLTRAERDLVISILETPDGR